MNFCEKGPIKRNCINSFIEFVDSRSPQALSVNTHVTSLGLIGNRRTRDLVHGVKSMTKEVYLCFSCACSLGAAIGITIGRLENTSAGRMVAECTQHYFPCKLHSRY